MTRNCFRCPDCWKPFQSAAMVKNHMHAMEGRCFDRLESWQQRPIRKYHSQFEIPHSRKFGVDTFEVVE